MSGKKPSKPNKGKLKVNIFIGGPLPPGATVFNPDGTIESTLDTPEVRQEWIVRKMTIRIEEDPDDGEWYYERGSALFKLGRFAEAIPDFSKLIELIPGWGEYYRMRGLCYYYTNDRMNALIDLRRYQELSKPENLEAEAMQILKKLESE